jgi:glycosyltransferase involved in cell wall biosynthesis
MRVAVFNTNSSGGAARAMQRLALGLTRRGHEVDILQPAGADPIPEAIRFTAELGTPAGTNLADFIDGQYIPRRRSLLSDTLFTAQSRGFDLGHLRWLRSYDVLNLHWVQFFLNPESVATLIDLGRPVVLTLHDMAGFTGGCHYSAGCDGYAHNCTPCPQLNEDSCALPRTLLAAKRQIFARSNVAAVAPSRWLADAAVKSRVFLPGSVHHIWYSVETDRFHPGDCTAARVALGIDPDARTILFGAYQNAERRKGFRHLMAAIRRLRLIPAFSALLKADKLKFLIFGQATPEMQEQGLPVVDLGYVVDDWKLAHAYNAADLLVLPSLDENQPNIMLEAMACGTPVVSFMIGGMVDVIRDGVNGRLIPPFDIDSLAQAILDLLLNPASARDLGEVARRDIVENAALDVQARNYEALFESMLSNSEPVRADLQTHLQLKERARQHPVAVPIVISPRVRTPEVIVAYERFRTGVDRYATPEAAMAAQLATLHNELAQISVYLDQQARLLLTSRSWRLSQRIGLGTKLTLDQIIEMGSVSEKLWAIWAVLHSRRWESMAPLRLLNRLLRPRA